MSQLFKKLVRKQYELLWEALARLPKYFRNPVKLSVCQLSHLINNQIILRGISRNFGKSVENLGTLGLRMIIGQFQPNLIEEFQPNKPLILCVSLSLSLKRCAVS